MILGIICARGGSAMKDKNIRELCGRPMIEYTISAAKYSYLDDWFVFTDKYTQYPTLGIERPPEYSQGEYNSVMKWLPYAVSEYEKKYFKADHIMLLQPTSPLRTSEDINNAIKMYSGASLVSGYCMRIKSNEVDNKNKPKHFQRNGAIFLFSKEMLMSGKLWDANTQRYEMPVCRSVDIDTEEDFFMAECILKELKIRKTL